MNKIKEAQEILKSLQMPAPQCNEMSALTLLALCGITKKGDWSKATRKSLTVTKGIMFFMKEHYDHEYAPNSRETVRRNVLHQFVQAGIASYNPDNPKLPTNSPNAHYAITSDVLKVVKSYNSDDFNTKVSLFINKIGSLKEIYNKTKQMNKVSVKLPDDSTWTLSPGRHNKLQAEIIEEFASRFVKEPEVLYLGDTAKKTLILNKTFFSDNNVILNEHSKLPDIIIHDKLKNWLFLIEAVTSHGPMSPKRIVEIEQLFKTCTMGKVYISAFLTFSDYKKYSTSIAWETEIWIAEAPEHMIHYNGDRFYGPRE